MDSGFNVAAKREGSGGCVREPVLRLEGVVQGFRRGRNRWRVLRGVSLSVGVGEFVGLLGGRGEGKTTLLRIAAGVDVPEEGRVWFEGRDLVTYSCDERDELLGTRIAWMHRGDFGGFDVLSYVALPLADDGGGMRVAQERAMVALDRVGVVDCAACGWGELSDWERLLATFARGYAVGARLLVVDDLLDTLGAGGSRRASELLLSFTRELGCGVMAGASDLGALLAADRVLHFDGEGGLSSGQAGPVGRRDFPGAAHAG